jgi:hypothetical protein
VALLLLVTRVLIMYFGVLRSVPMVWYAGGDEE